VNGRITAVIHSHVDDLLSATLDDCPVAASIFDKLKTQLHLKKKTGDFDYCGKRITVHNDRVTISQGKMINSVERIALSAERRSAPTAPITESERSAYRSLLGQLQWLASQSRPDIAFEVNRAAQKTTRATVSDIQNMNTIVDYLKNHIDFVITVPRGRVDVMRSTIITYGDSSFANVEGEKSQAGIVCSLTEKPDLVWRGRFDLQVPISWNSSTVKRIVRSTLAAEAYSVSEAVEHGQWLRHILTEFQLATKTPSGAPVPIRTVELECVKRPLITFTDSHNLADTVGKDAGTCADKRLRIVISMLRQAFAPGEGTVLLWLQTVYMVADGLTKLLTPKQKALIRAYFGSVKHDIEEPLARGPAPRSPAVKIAAALAMLPRAAAHSPGSDAMYLSGVFVGISGTLFFMAILGFLACIIALCYCSASERPGSSFSSTSTRTTNPENASTCASEPEFEREHGSSSMHPMPATTSTAPTSPSTDYVTRRRVSRLVPCDNLSDCIAHEHSCTPGRNATHVWLTCQQCNWHCSWKFVPGGRGVAAYRRAPFWSVFRSLWER